MQCLDVPSDSGEFHPLLKMAYFHLPLAPLILLLSSTSNISPSHALVLNSPQVTNWGTWQHWEYCPNGTYVVGFALKTEPYLGGWVDDSALNGIRFYCDQIGSKSSNRFISSGVHRFGAFGNNFFCDGVATGFQLQSEPNQGPIIDDTAANNLRIYCNAGDDGYLEGDGMHLGSFTAKQKCNRRQAFCGIQTQIWIPSSGDETSLDNIRVKCCDVPDPAEVCVPVDTWNLVQECDNIYGLSPMICEYERKIGISQSVTYGEGGYVVYEVYQEIGFGIGGAAGALNLNFVYNLGYSETTGFDWYTSSTEIWTVETISRVSFEVPPGIRTQLFQTVGTCDFYNAKATRFRRIDSNETMIENVTFFE